MDISVPQAQASHIIAVINTASLGSGWRVFMNRSSSDAPALYLGQSSANYKPTIYWGTGAVITNTTALQNLRVQEFRLGSSVVGLRSDGGTEQTASHSKTQLSTWVTLTTTNASSQQAAFSMGEFIITNQALSDDDRQKIEGYLAHKWDSILGVTTLVTALPSDHPYKSTAPVVE